MARDRRFVVDHDQMRALLPLFALGALEEGEREAVVAHLPRCNSCPTELAEWTRVATDLAYTPERQAPPEHLKSTLLAATASPERSARGPGDPSSGRLRRIAVPLAAGLALVAVGLSAYLAGQIQELAATQEAFEARVAGQRETIRFLTSDDLVAVSLQADPPLTQAAGRVYLIPGESTGMLSVENLPLLPPGRSYQLWLLVDGGRDSGGLFEVDESGRGYLVIRAPRPLSQYDQVGITEEPEGGSLTPSGERLLGGSL